MPGMPSSDDASAPELAVPGGWWALFEAAPVAHALVEVPGGAIVAANRAFFELMRLTRRDLALLDPLLLSHPDDRDLTRDGFLRMVRGECRAIEIEKRYRRGDGTEFWARVQATLLPSVDDDSWLVLGTCTDISEEMQARDVLEQRVARTSALLAGLSDVVVVIDASLRITFVSPSVERLIGSGPEELVGCDALDLVHPDDADAVADRLTTQIAVGGRDAPLRFRVVPIDGRAREVEATSVNLLDDHLVEGVVIILRPLTDEAVTTAQDILRRRYRQMLAHVADRVNLIDTKGEAIEEIGPGSRSLAHDAQRSWTPAETLERCHPDHRARLVQEFGRLFAGAGEQLHERFAFSDGDGGWMTLEFEGINRSDDPDIGATVLTTRDVTHDEAVARELAEARDQAVRALEARSEFVATVSHELRTPIHGILGLAELLADSDDEEARRIAGLVERSAESLRLMVDDILDLSKLEAGRLEILSGPIDVRALRDDLVAMFEHDARARGLDIAIELAAGFPEWVWGDGLRVRQVLTNLLGNAVKFTETGEIRLTVTTEAAPAGSGVDDLARITVSDTGIGIPHDVQRDIFQPFSTAHGRTAHRYGGTGLGLVITLKLVEALDGTLLFESEPDVGTTFTVLFPLAPLAVDAEGRPVVPTDPPVTEPEVRPVTATEVLVVEDNPVNQLLIARQLEVLGYAAEVVDDGESAIARFCEASPAAVLMDLRLPGVDGLGATTRMREIERESGRPRTPIVAMTASGLAGDRKAAERSGMDGFLSKPVGLTALRDALTQWCGIEPTNPPTDVADHRHIIDFGVPDQLVDELDDPALVAHLCELFVRELPSRTTAIQDALGDSAALRASSHALRSAALTLGGVGLVELCERLDAARPGDRPAVLADLPQVAQATAQQLTLLATRYRARVR